MIHKTNICCLNTSKSIIDYLRQEHSIYDGRLGDLIDLTAKGRGSKFLLPTYDFPKNIQEYDIFVVDLKNGEYVMYDEADHTRNHVGETRNLYFLSKTNQTIFDTYPLGACMFKKRLFKDSVRKPIVIVFQGAKKDCNYTVVDRTSMREYRYECEEKHSNYDFAPSLPFADIESGQIVSLSDKKISHILFEGLENNLQYDQLFYHPQKYNSEILECEPDPCVIPLLVNRDDNLISFIQIKEKEPIYFVLPQADDTVKLTILQRLFEKVLYEKYSNYFPFLESIKWVHKDAYMLPSIKEIKTKIEIAEQEFLNKKELLNNEIERVEQQFNFLQNLITATGEDLVAAMLEYFSWLGFENVVEKDATANSVLEEDIQVDLGNNGLLIVETKGLYGTSKDSECSQIEKIKHRREKERQRFDVYALYIVNHQRGIEPLKRMNPPFTTFQIEDAKTDGRGLLTTWQLYNIYHAIEFGVISKKQVMEDLLQYGCIEFHPNLVQVLNTPYEYWQHDTILGIDVNTPISVGDVIFSYYEGQWFQSKVVSLQQDKIPYETVDSGRTGIQIDKKLPKGEFYIKHEIH